LIYDYGYINFATINRDFVFIIDFEVWVFSLKVLRGLRIVSVFWSIVNANVSNIAVHFIREKQPNTDFVFILNW